MCWIVLFVNIWFACHRRSYIPSHSFDSFLSLSLSLSNTHSLIHSVTLVPSIYLSFILSVCVLFTYSCLFYSAILVRLCAQLLVSPLETESKLVYVKIMNILKCVCVEFCTWIKTNTPNCMYSFILKGFLLLLLVVLFLNSDWIVAGLNGWLLIETHHANRASLNRVYIQYTYMHMYIDLLNEFEVATRLSFQHIWLIYQGSFHINPKFT